MVVSAAGFEKIQKPVFMGLLGAGLSLAGHPVPGHGLNVGLQNYK